jgi:hypothetical protein
MPFGARNQGSSRARSDVARGGHDVVPHPTLPSCARLSRCSASILLDFDAIDRV